MRFYDHIKDWNSCDRICKCWSSTRPYWLLGTRNISPGSYTTYLQLDQLCNTCNQGRHPFSICYKCHRNLISNWGISVFTRMLQHQCQRFTSHFSWKVFTVEKMGILDRLKKDTLSCRNTGSGLHSATLNSHVFTTAGLWACSVSKASSCKGAAEFYGWWMTLPDRRPTMVICPQEACTHTTLRRSSLPPFSSRLLRKLGSYITQFSEPWQPHTKTSMPPHV